MRVLKNAVLVATVLILAVSAQTAGGPYDRVAKGKPPAKDDVKVYTNKDLEKRFGVAKEEDREPPAKPAAPAATASPAEPGSEPPPGEPAPPAETDPLMWLQQRQAALKEYQKAVQDAEAALGTAQKNLADLERQLLATRNPYAARPVLSDEEREDRRKSGETAADRNQRTQRLVEDAREAVRAAEAELARTRAERP